MFIYVLRFSHTIQFVFYVFHMDPHRSVWVYEGTQPATASTNSGGAGIPSCLRTPPVPWRCQYPSRRPVGRSLGHAAGRSVGRTDCWTDRRTIGQKDRRTDGQLDGQATAGQMDRPVDDGCRTLFKFGSKRGIMKGSWWPFVVPDIICAMRKNPFYWAMTFRWAWHLIQVAIKMRNNARLLVVLHCSRPDSV